MNETAAEVIILTVNALSAGALVFIARVVRPLMNQMSAPEFKIWLTRLIRSAITEPLLVTVGTLPIVGAVLYFYLFGINHGWFAAGLIAWLVGSAASKIINQPIYNWVGDPRNTDPGELLKRRACLGIGNNLRALINMISVLLMVAQFGPVETAIATLASAIFSVPLIWFAGRYIAHGG
ncbi:MAG: hypothetical protein E5X34_27795 [Mesorhizobium sp.]|uniref:hypothetical protein n=1 Tax=Mesorhizobium sp. TaxID=1871066 RepID=UPI00121028E5|nr:hypothetical protein [Mesorhizobium sp.]TIR15844.1 MAG: hypothetical protein E5X34_27795 [Mesorhizobium sp.]